MRVMLVWEFYPGYVDALYRRTPQLAEQPFDAQLEQVLDDCLPLAGPGIRRVLTGTQMPPSQCVV